MTGIRHEPTGRADLARISIEGLERDLRVLHLTDSHIVEADERDPEAAPHVEAFGPNGFYRHTPDGASTGDVFDRAVAEARQTGVDGGVFTGDMVHFPSWAGIEHVERGMKDPGVPTLYTPGNHDWHFPHLEWSDAVRQEYYPRLHRLTGGTPACQLPRGDGP